VKKSENINISFQKIPSNTARKCFSVVALSAFQKDNGEKSGNINISFQKIPSNTARKCFSVVALSAFQKDNGEKKSKKRNIFFKQFLQKQPGNVFPLLPCPLFKKITAKKNQKNGIYFLNNSFKNSPKMFFRCRPLCFQKNDDEKSEKRILALFL